MPNLTLLEHVTPFPLPRVFVNILLSLAHFTQLHFVYGGVESLPHILPLAPQITHLSLDSFILRITPPPPSFTHYPFTVARARREKLARTAENVATWQEQQDALVDGLAKFLLAAHDHLVSLEVDGEGASGPWVPVPDSIPEKRGLEWLQRTFDAMKVGKGAYPSFPCLEGLRIGYVAANCPAMQHLLKSSVARLTRLHLLAPEKVPLSPPPKPLPLLTHLCWTWEDNLTGLPFLKSLTFSSPLKVLVLNGILPSEIPRLFGDPLTFKCGDTLREVRIVPPVYSPFKVEHLAAIAEACPKVEHLLVKANIWVGRAEDFLATLSAPTSILTSSLRSLVFNHRWRPRPPNSPWPWPDGETIRSFANGDFSVISVFGTSLEEAMRGRVEADLEAVKPFYLSQFTSLAHAIPALETVCSPPPRSQGDSEGEDELEVREEATIVHKGLSEDATTPLGICGVMETMRLG
ncbi:hypothetical protein JCM6882_000014 [Rhodosporidiobolus microsporus]